MQCMGAREYLSEVSTQLVAFNLRKSYRRLGRKRAELTGSVVVADVKKGCIGQRVDLSS